MKIRRAEKKEYQKVRHFYDEVIDLMAYQPYSSGWQKGIYPEDHYLRESINHKELFIGLDGDQIIAAMVINHHCNESYQKIKWDHSFQTNEVMIIHILCVHPAYGKKGLGKVLVKKAIEYAQNHQQKALRLDVLQGNLPAEKLYESQGFQYIDTISMYYEDTGWTDYEIYEYII